MRSTALALALVAGTLAPQAQAADIVVAGGCFWCVEADFEKVTGVSEAVSGYTGGSVEDPSYRQVVRGNTGHFESVRIEYDSDAISVRQLYDLFFRSIDPFDAGGQFCDRGSPYRTAIFVDGPEERAAAEASKAAAEAELGRDVVTPILPLEDFYVAEDYHQDYYKSDVQTLTRFGYVSRAEAYDGYRRGCRRDARVREVWGDDAPFVGG